METSTSSKASKANITFSLALLKKLRDDGKTANVFYSPFSVSSALAMVMLGAKGNTAKQMSEVRVRIDTLRHAHQQLKMFCSHVNTPSWKYL